MTILVFNLLAPIFSFNSFIVAAYLAMLWMAPSVNESWMFSVANNFCYPHQVGGLLNTC